MLKTVSRYALVSLCTLIAGCGGGGSAPTPDPGGGEPPTPPSVIIDDTRVVVPFTGGVVVVRRNPYHLSVRRTDGSTVLEEVASPSAPVSTGVLQLTPMPSPAVYAPLTFMVGVRTHEQMTGIHLGNSKSGGLLASEYAAVAVTSARVVDDGAELTLSTSDPSGRQLVVTVSPKTGESAFRFRVRASPSTGVVTINESFLATPSEAFRGFGGRHNALDQRGNNFYNWVEQENDQTDQTTTNLTPNGPTAAYYVQPQFVSSRGYGFALDQYEMSSFRLATDRAGAWQTSVAGSELRAVVAVGDAPTVIASLTRVSGRQPVAPRWALGAIESKVSSALNIFDATGYANSIDAALAAIDQHQLPLTGFQLHQWRHFDAATLEHYIGEIHRRDMRVLVYFKCNMDNLNIGYDSTADYQMALANGYFVLNADGSSADLVDFTNPAAVTWWKGRITAALDLGIDGFMQDFGEQITATMQFASGESGESLHNRYPVLYHRATREAFDAYRAAHPERELWFFTRSGYTGSAAYEGGNFPGDNSSDFGRANGLASCTTDMLNRGIGGAYGFVNDIGGYFDLKNPGLGVPRETWLRWVEWAALSPFFLNHNGMVGGTTHAWTFGDAEAINIYRRYAQLRQQAAPLIQQLWTEAVATGMPIARPLWLAYPDDPIAAAQDQQWLLGPDVLVAPVVTAGATTRQVYFPAGVWVRASTGQRYVGPRTESVPAALGQLPYFIREGSDPFGDAPVALSKAKRQGSSLAGSSPQTPGGTSDGGMGAAPGAGSSGGGCGGGSATGFALLAGCLLMVLRWRSEP